MDVSRPVLQVPGFFEGLPSVKFCADRLHLSANYFGDLVKKETGRTAREHIQSKLIDVAKERIFDTRRSVSEIAYEMGFCYPQHFTRFFKKVTGLTPKEYRMPNRSEKRKAKGEKRDEKKSSASLFAALSGGLRISVEKTASCECCSRW